MKLIIEFGEDELLHPQMVAAIAAQLESQVNDEDWTGLPSTPSYSETGEKPPDIEVFIAPASKEVLESKEDTFTIDELRKMALVIAEKNKSAKPVLDILEKASGVRRLFENDNTHYSAIGKAFTLAIKAFT